MDSFYNWYDSVDDDASPENVFWEEMERQRLMSQIGSGSAGGGGDGELGAAASVAAVSGADAVGQGATSSSSFAQQPSSTAPMSVEEERGAEATLANYGQFMVSDNWLAEDLMMQNLNLDVEGDGEEEEQATYEEPWDTFGQEVENEKDDESGDVVMKLDVEKMKQIPELKDNIMDWDDVDEEEMKKEEEEKRERLSWINIRSVRLEKVRDNPNAKSYFARPPDELEGFDRMWVAAIDAPCLANLVGVFRNYGVQFADNFADWEDQSPEDAHWSIEDIASFKARQVYEATGLPCIASRTSFEIEPARKVEVSPNAPGRVPVANPRVQSGYKFNNIGDHVDYIVEALEPQTDPSRVTRFTSCLCYYDGEMEVLDYGYCDCDIYFSNSVRTFIPMAHAITEMCKTLQLTFGLEYQKWLKQKLQTAVGGRGGASIALRDRVLRDAKVLPNDIIDVSAFMDSNVDVDLMDDCAKELAERFTQMQVKPTKILTVATTGLVIAIPMAKYLQVPVVYARKERNVVMSSTYSAAFSSKTVGKNRELLVSTNHLNEEDHILIVDDFLSSGASQDALLRIVDDARATAVGVGVLLEKVYDSGRQSLSGYNVPVESLVRVQSVSEGVIRLLEEEGASSLFQKA
eukprot:CAMPEP_0113552278 /NCGR_PEP_ID=MMETSP0015_2-20120614/14981_1 /TAXON_ID=2838 /ORGANISM="Odontella" /LENGTH=631 /DNA_ID=CAMNT_0000453243 /DNA_START=376 /DNA_END=2274 /DNA_ORIENTATION=- /assembly_acc=CAM_ASM_000160